MPKSAPTQSDQLTDQATLNSTIAVLKRHFHLSAQGYVCRTDDLYRILVTTAARRSTIEATCNDLQGPDSNTVRGYLNAELTPADITDLERTCNRALYSQWPHWLWSQPLDIAVDLHDECYYGDDADVDPQTWVCRGEKRNGTTHFYRCATLAVVRHPVQLTLAVVFMPPAADLVKVLEKLLNYLRFRGLRIGCLYADKQFCSIPVLRYTAPAVGAGVSRGTPPSRRSLRCH